MSIKNNIKIVSLIIIALIITPNRAQAVMPPDFIFNIGAQIAQVFSIVALFFSTIIGIAWQFLNNRLGLGKHKKVWFAIIIILGIIISFSISYLYVNHERKAQYNDLLREDTSNAR